MSDLLDILERWSCLAGPLATAMLLASLNQLFAFAIIHLSTWDYSA